MRHELEGGINSSDNGEVVFRPAVVEVRPTLHCRVPADPETWLTAATTAIILAAATIATL